MHFQPCSMSGWIIDSIRLLNYLMKGHFCLKRADIGVWQVLVFYNLRSLEYKKVSISIFNLFSPSLYTFCTFHNTKKKYDIETRLDDRAIHCRDIYSNKKIKIYTMKIRKTNDIWWVYYRRFYFMSGISVLVV